MRQISTKKATELTEDILSAEAADFEQDRRDIVWLIRLELLWEIFDMNRTGTMTVLIFLYCVFSYFLLTVIVDLKSQIQYSILYAASMKNKVPDDILFMISVLHRTFLNLVCSGEDVINMQVEYLKNQLVHSRGDLIKYNFYRSVNPIGLRNPTAFARNEIVNRDDGQKLNADGSPKKEKGINTEIEFTFFCWRIFSFSYRKQPPWRVLKRIQI